MPRTLDAERTAPLKLALAAKEKERPSAPFPAPSLEAPGPSAAVPEQKPPGSPRQCLGGGPRAARRSAWEEAPEPLLRLRGGRRRGLWVTRSAVPVCVGSVREVVHVRTAGAGGGGRLLTSNACFLVKCCQPATCFKFSHNPSCKKHRNLVIQFQKSVTI